MRALAVAQAQHGAELRVEAAEILPEMRGNLAQHFARVGVGAALVMRTARGAQHHQRERVAMPLAVEIPVPFAKQLLRFGERRVAFGVEREIGRASWRERVCQYV